MHLYGVGLGDAKACLKPWHRVLSPGTLSPRAGRRTSVKSDLVMRRMPSTQSSMKVNDRVCLPSPHISISSVLVSTCGTHAQPGAQRPAPLAPATQYCAREVPVSTPPLIGLSDLFSRLLDRLPDQFASKHCRHPCGLPASAAADVTTALRLALPLSARAGPSTDQRQPNAQALTAAPARARAQHAARGGPGRGWGQSNAN